jgi:hypothetical protein
MKKLLVFILLGLAFAAPGEILNQILARRNVQAFRSTMISYAGLLLIGFFVGKGISAVFKKSRARLIYYLLFGFLGLMVEWFLLGNAPVLEPFQVITQPGMFTYWGTKQLCVNRGPPTSCTWVLFVKSPNVAARPMTRAFHWGTEFSDSMLRENPGSERDAD